MGESEVAKPRVKRTYSVLALDKAIKILDVMSAKEGDFDLATLSKMVQMPKSTLLRLLYTMKSHNLIRQDSETKRFNLGLALVALGKAAEKKFDLVKHIHPFLVELSDRTNETASLVILEGSHAVYIDQVLSSNMIVGRPRIGVSIDLHCSSCGKILLGSKSDDWIQEHVLSEPLSRMTSKTTTDPEVLLKEIRRVRAVKYAVDDEEVEVGGRCVAAPVWDKDGNIIAAISVMGPTTRIRQKDFPEIGAILKDVSLRASIALGYRPA